MRLLGVQPWAMGGPPPQGPGLSTTAASTDAGQRSGSEAPLRAVLLPAASPLRVIPGLSFPGVYLGTPFLQVCTIASRRSSSNKVIEMILQAAFRHTGWNRPVSCQPSIFLTPHSRLGGGMKWGYDGVIMAVAVSVPSCLTVLLPAPALEAGCQPGALLSQGALGLGGKRIQQARQRNAGAWEQQWSTKLGVEGGTGGAGESRGGAGKEGNDPNVTKMDTSVCLSCG